jgi:hypothetical protein
MYVRSESYASQQRRHMPPFDSAAAGRGLFQIANTSAIDLTAGNIGADNDPFSFISRTCQDGHRAIYQ